MKNELPVVQIERIEERIYAIRGQRVMLDADLARLYSVSTKRLNEQVKRNRKRFPANFMFQLTAVEKTEVVANCDHLRKLRFSHALPYAFSEHGAIMVATVLNTSRAIQVSVFVVEAFVKMRAALSNHRELAHKLTALEKELKERLDIHEAAIVSILQRVMDIIDPPALPPPPKKEIGFQVKESNARYVVRRHRS